MNKRTSSHSSVAPLKNRNGDIVACDKDKANLLNDFFGSVCTQDNGSNPQFEPRVNGDEINTVKFDAAKVIAAAKRMKTKRPLSSGPDGYPVMLLNNTVNVLSYPLAQMFQSYISVGKLPSCWKTAIVTPIYKKGPSSDPNNYRPISQTSIFYKLLERVLVADITFYMMQKGSITRHQHGFINRRSTTTNLLETMSDWTLSIDNKQTQSIVYVDFSKAFDSVSRPKLITKLQGYGISGDLLNLISDFLSNRSQRTRIGRSLSESVDLTSGIVQGSCLGPLLFLIFINDLADIFDNEVTPKFYADDLKLYTSIESNLDNARLQRNIDRLVDWASKWQLPISIQKCQVMQVGNKRRSEPIKTVISLGTAVLPTCNTIRDLGIHVDDELKFSEHINLIVSKALSRSYLLRKCFVSRDRDTLVKGFTVYVRPLLEYCSTVWSPHLHKDIEAIERVQRRFTKYLPGLRSYDYTDRLKIVGLERLEIRRIRFDLIMAYKIIFGLTCLQLEDFFQFSPCSSTRGHEYKLLVLGAKCDTRKYFFSVRICQIWNDLPNDTDFGSLENIKTY